MKPTILFVLIFILLPPPAPAAEGSYINSALEAARWIQSSSVDSPEGRAWPVDPQQPEGIVTSLYSGTPGVILFFIELSRLSGDKQFLKEAEGGGDYLISRLKIEGSDAPEGLYTGLAGVAFTLNELHKASRQPRFRTAALHCLERLQKGVSEIGQGADWNSVTDVIGGSAGIGLFLLYAAVEMEQPAALQLAVRAGRHLVEQGVTTEDGGLKWAMSKDFPRMMPNFSHGTAGICYFLTRLYIETGQSSFLQAAVRGARHLQRIAKNQGNACLVFHHEPGGENLYYLSWCHGPAGTARLFYSLWQTTQEPEWLQWAHKLARGVVISGIPEKQTPGFWNNVSVCCGSAGVASFFLNLHQVAPQHGYLEFAKKMANAVMIRATDGGTGKKWVQAEHRVKPEFAVAQTGYMQGAAGIGMMLLQFHAAETGERLEITFPDSPY